MYVGPEVLMPLASIMAAITGVLMLFWRRTVGAFRAVFQFVSRRFTGSGTDA
ncbi:MAG: hypothetical protein ACE5HF_07525 [Gemmatimonadota bacterium]